MNIPNRLTVFRIILMPVFIFFMMDTALPNRFLFALITFGIASLTDLVDGHLARKYNQVTTFGKFLDPLADKILVVSALVCLVSMGYANTVAVIVIIAREFAVTSLRLIAVSSDGTVMAAGPLGKLKTVVQMVVIVGILLGLALMEFGFLGVGFDLMLYSNIAIWIAALLTAVSGADYLIRNRSFINTTK